MMRKNLFKNFQLMAFGLLVLFPFQNCSAPFSLLEPSTIASTDAGVQEIESIANANRFKAAREVLQRNCTSCHYSNAPGGPLVFDNEADYIAAKLVTPGSVSTSKLITRLRNYTAPIEGRNMPPLGPISNQDFAILTAWVGSMPIVNAEIFSCAPDEKASGLDARRLSKTEMLNSLRRIFSRPFGAAEAEQILTGSTATLIERIPNDSRAPYSRSDRAFESSHADAYFDLAEELANSATNSSRYSRLVSTFVNYAAGSCSGLNVNTLSVGCRDAFINNFLMRLWGRPLESAELAAYQAEFVSGVSSVQAVNNFLFRAFLSPQFLNHLYTDVTPIANGEARLSSFAIARRLSYHFQLAGLDESLLTLAATTDLTNDTNYAVALNSLSNAPSAMLQDFVDDWLKLYRIASIPTPNSTKWSQITAGLAVDNNLRAAMRQEILDLVTYLNQNGRPVQDLLTSNVATARNADLMRVYGQTTAAPTTFNETSAVRLPAEERAGIATRAGYLYNSTDTERPVVRGLHVMDDFLCSEVKGQIPPQASMTVIPSGILTTREKYEQATASSSCTGCHAQINPIGNAFAKYNAFGGFQVNEPIFVDGVFRQTLPVSSRVSLQAALQENVTVEDGVEFSRWMATSAHFRACLTKKYHTYVQRLNAMPTATNSCDMSRMSEIIRNNGSLTDFFRAPAVDSRFRRRTLTQ